MKPPSDVFDLLTADGTRHANAKSMAFLTTLLTFSLIAVALIWNRTFTWPFVAALGLLMYGPYGLDGLKTIAKLKFRHFAVPMANGFPVGAEGLGPKPGGAT